MAVGWAETYCRQLSWQTEVLWRHELPVIASAPAFVAARTVLDLGAGNGAFGRRLAQAFPGKRFVGIEPNTAVHAVGARTPSPPNYRYVNSRYETVDGVHDVVFARLVVMYLPDRDAFYAWARRHARAAIVVNSEDAATSSAPAMPLVDAALREGFRARADELATTLVGDRDLQGMQHEWAAAGFLPAGSASIVADLRDPDDLRLLHHVGRNVVAAANPDAVTRELVDELYRWSTDPAARATIGMTYHCVLNPQLAGDELGRAPAA